MPDGSVCEWGAPLQMRSDKRMNFVSVFMHDPCSGLSIAKIRPTTPVELPVRETQLNYRQPSQGFH